MINPTFDPDPEVLPDALWLTRWLTDRDLGAQVPINYLTRPAISLSAACFSDMVYDDTRAAKCISNLLQARFERLIIDLYWDPSSSQFNLCPVSLESISAGSASVSLPTASSRTLSQVSATLSSASIGTQGPVPTDVGTPRPKRQLITSSSTAVSTLITSSNATSTFPSLSVVSTSASNAALYQAGPYQCSKSLDLPWLMGFMQSFLQQTEDTLNANVIILEVNIHAAASADQPEGPAPKPRTLPSNSLLIGTQLSSMLGSFIYTPDNLASDRNNLNDTWYRVPLDRVPILEYMDSSGNDSGDLRTTTGWPNIAFLLLEKVQRLLITWGKVDPQMEAYNFRNDTAVFPAGAMSTERDVQSSSDGNVISGCLYDASRTSASQINASWAFPPSGEGPVVSSTSALQSLLYLNGNLSLCGISPTLNQTIMDQPADRVSVPYLNVSQSAVWAWASEEPRNYTASKPSRGDDELYRCALLDLRPPYDGRWRVENCNERYRVACRDSTSPFVFHISENDVPFAGGPASCPPNSSFAVPRTGLESNYLLHYLRSLPSSIIDNTKDSGDHRTGVWVNFNSLDVQDCWTARGPNATCPYSGSRTIGQQRAVLVPIIASIVVLVLAAITVFVKCAGNRRMSKRTKRGEGGWDYEGVPS